MAYVNVEPLFRARLESAAFYEVKFSTNVDRIDVYFWCQANAVGRYFVSSFYVTFSDPEDAIKCKLVWGESENR